MRPLPKCDYETARARRSDRRNRQHRDTQATARFRFSGQPARRPFELEEAQAIIEGRGREPQLYTPEQIRRAGARLFVARELTGAEDLLGFRVRADQLLRPDDRPPSTKFREAVQWLRGLIDHRRHEPSSAVREANEDRGRPNEDGPRPAGFKIGASRFHRRRLLSGS